MITLPAHEAPANFRRLLADVARGETVVITEGGRPVAEVRPPGTDVQPDAARLAAFERMVALMQAWPDTGYRVGKITDADKYGELS